MGGAEEVPAAVAVGVVVDLAAPNTPGAFTDMGGAEEVPAAVAVGAAVDLAAPITPNKDFDSAPPLLLPNRLAGACSESFFCGEDCPNRDPDPDDDPEPHPPAAAVVVMAGLAPNKLGVFMPPPAAPVAADEPKPNLGLVS
jgi:hypothetical protein